MSLKSKFIHILRFSLIFILIIFCALVALYFYLPAFIASHVIPQIAQKAKLIGIEDFSCSIRRTGLTGADFGEISVGKNKDTALSIASLQIDYTPKTLYKKKIEKIIFSGVELYCGVKKGKFFLRGVDLEKIFSRQSEKSESSDSDLPISIGCIEIRKAQVIFQWEKKEYRIPFDLLLVPVTQHVIQADLTVYPESQKINLTAAIDLNKKKADINIDARSVLINRLSDFAEILVQEQLVLSGELDIKAEASLRFAPFKIISLSAESEIRNHGTAYKNIRLGKAPLQIKITGNENREWNLLLSSFSLSEPVPLQIPSVNMRLNLYDKMIKYSVNISDIKSDYKALKIPSLVLKGEFETEKQNLSFDLTASDTGITTKALNVRLPDISISGKLNKYNFDSRTTIKNADISFPLSDLKINGIQSVIPLKIPCKDSDTKSKISAGKIIWNKMDMGAVTGFIQQKSSDFIFEINNENKVIPGLKLICRGKALIPFGFKADPDKKTTSEIHLLLSRNKNSPDIDLGKFFPKAKGILVNGDLDAKIDWTFEPDRVKSSLLSSLNHGLLTYSTNPSDKEKIIAVKGISLDFSMPELSRGCSAPKQHLQFKNASFGKLNISDGIIEFQLESGNSFLIEKSSFKWCSGNVNSESLRILSGGNEYDLILYCDRLNLAKVLEQFGAGNAEGEGTVNGRIPIAFKNGEFSFHDGFLFSTPGDGGTIHITDTGMLTAGIPENTLQYAQLDLAREALKNFEYKWVKLRLNTEKEDLKLKLQFDGKPANPLPFIYKQEFGGFVRVESGTKSSNFQGISLDVNMGLPLNKILLYKDILKSF